MNKYVAFVFTKDFYSLVFAHPKSLLSSLFFTAFYGLKHPNMIKASLHVESFLPMPEAVYLYRAALNSQKHSSPNIVEVGAYKGKSTIFLSLAAHQIDKRVKSFEWFLGLPEVDPDLDSIFEKNTLSSAPEEYDSNVRTYGRRDKVDLTVGDARKTLLPVLGETGFCFAFLDVDTYEVTKNLISQLLRISWGGEVIYVHDTWSPGVRHAIAESIASSPRIIRQSEPVYNTAKLEVLPN